jgi:hypothetical protein
MLMSTNLSVGPPYVDIPQRQLGTVILPPDPLPLIGALPEPYAIDEIWPRLLQNGRPRYLQRSTCSRSMQAKTYYQQGQF